MVAGSRKVGLKPQRRRDRQGDGAGVAEELYGGVVDRRVEFQRLEKQFAVGTAHLMAKRSVDLAGGPTRRFQKGRESLLARLDALTHQGVGISPHEGPRAVCDRLVLPAATQPAGLAPGPRHTA